MMMVSAKLEIFHYFNINLLSSDCWTTSIASIHNMKDVKQLFVFLATNSTVVIIGSKWNLGLYKVEQYISFVFNHSPRTGSCYYLVVWFLKFIYREKFLPSKTSVQDKFKLFNQLVDHNITNLVLMMFKNIVPRTHISHYKINILNLK